MDYYTVHTVEIYWSSEKVLQRYFPFILKITFSYTAKPQSIQLRWQLYFLSLSLQLKKDYRVRMTFMGKCISDKDGSIFPLHWAPSIYCILISLYEDKCTVLWLFLSFVEQWGLTVSLAYRDKSKTCIETI